MDSRRPFRESWIDLTSPAASSRHSSMLLTAALHVDSRSRPSMGKRMSRGVLAHKGGQEPVDCQDISRGDAPVFGIVVFGFGVGPIIVGCEFEV